MSDRSGLGRTLIVPELSWRRGARSSRVPQAPLGRPRSTGRRHRSGIPPPCFQRVDQTTWAAPPYTFDPPTKLHVHRGRAGANTESVPRSLGDAVKGPPDLGGLVVWTVEADVIGSVAHFTATGPRQAGSASTARLLRPLRV